MAKSVAIITRLLIDKIVFQLLKLGLGGPGVMDVSERFFDVDKRTGGGQYPLVPILKIELKNGQNSCF